MGKIVIDDGREEYEIVNKFGDIIGKFRMNPSDMGMIRRYNAFGDEISSMTEGVSEDMESEEILRKLESRLFVAFDDFFGSQVSHDIFGTTSPFSPMSNGELYFETVITAICSLIEQETGERLKKVNAKVAKYAAKYNA